jgi:hypothetical protein
MLKNIKMLEKLKQIPPVYYFNLDHRTDRKEHIENQFLKYGIKDYTRVSSSRYSDDNFDEWKSKIIIDKLTGTKKSLSILIDRIQGIVDWYNSGISETCLIIEDDLTFDSVQYWNFDWNTFVNNLPCNWDCIQLHIIGENYIPMYLSKWNKNNHSTGCILINRKYAENLIKLHCKDNKFILYSNYGYGKNWPEYHYQSVDFVLYQIGITYSIPLFITNSNFISDSDGLINGNVNMMSKISDAVVMNWWKNKSHMYSNDEIFHLDNSKRKELIFGIKYGFK